MSRSRTVVALIAALALSVAAAPSSPAAPVADAAAKKCKKGYTKKKVKGKTKCVKKKSKSKTTGTGPYRVGQVCALAKNTEYAKYGLVCLDLSTPGFPLTTLDKK